MVKRSLQGAIAAPRPRFRVLHNWQRVPARFVTDGWLRPEGADGDEASLLPHWCLDTLLALYAQLFQENLEVDPVMQGNEFEVDIAAIVSAISRPKEKIEKALRLLQKRGFISSTRKSIAMLDPTTRAWPPRSFAMLPVRYAMEKLPDVQQLATRRGVKSSDVLALYMVLVVQRNHVTEEVWYSREKSSWMAGLEPTVALKCLSVLMRANLVVRSGLSTFKYLLLGFEAAEPSQ